MSLRRQLILWYALTMPLLIFALVFTARHIMVASLRTALDDTLHDHTEMVVRDIAANLGSGNESYTDAVSQAMAEELPSLTLLLRVSDTQGNRLAVVGHVPDPIIRALGVTIPYHSNLLAEAAKVLSATVFSSDVKAPELPIISVLNQDLITDAGRARNEVVNNIFNPFNWQATQMQMCRSGIRLFTECGPSQSLRKNSRFIPDCGRFVNWNSLLSQ